MKKFSYEVDGTDGAGQAFKVAGEVESRSLPDAVVTRSGRSIKASRPARPATASRESAAARDRIVSRELLWSLPIRRSMACR